MKNNLTALSGQYFETVKILQKRTDYLRRKINTATDEGEKSLLQCRYNSLRADIRRCRETAEYLADYYKFGGASQ